MRNWASGVGKARTVPRRCQPAVHLGGAWRGNPYHERPMAATILIVEDEYAVARGIQYAL